MIEFALVIPVLAVMIIGTFGVIIASLRILQAGTISHLAGAMAASGVDMLGADARAKLLDAGKGLGIERGDTTILITEIVRDEAGYRIGKTVTLGNEVRWKSLIRQPEGVVELEPGERAWVTEVVTESLRIGGIGPAEFRTRNVS